MKTIQYKNVYDKSKWERGEWDDEPDKIQWQDKSTKYPCMIVRHSSGHLCGYVGVSVKHPYFEKGDDCYSGSDDSWLDVHGGLTYVGKCQTKRKECEAVCHKVELGEDDNIWWLGFDCAHAGDYSSMSYSKDMCIKYPHDEDIYRNIGYVKSQCKSLAEQLAAVDQNE